MAGAGLVVVGSVAWTAGGASATAQEAGPPYFAPVAGTGESGSAGDGRAATDASIGEGPDIAVGPDGTLYIADGERVRAVNRDGVITAVPGTGPAPEGGEARGVAVGPDGALYVAGGNTVRQVAPDGSVAWTADLDAASPASLAVDGSGNAYFGGGGGIVVRVGRDGTSSTIGGGGTLDPVAAEGKPATEANLGDFLWGVTVDAAGTVYLTVPSTVMPQNNAARLLRIDQDGTLHTVAGAGEEGFSGDGGPAVQAQVGRLLTAPAVDGDGNIYFYDQENLLVRVVGSDGVITSLAALPPVPGEVGERLNEVAVGPGGELYVSAESVVYRLTRGGRSWTAGPAREPDYPARFPEAEPGTVHTVAGTGSERSAETGELTSREVGKPATEVPLPGNVLLRRMAVQHDGRLLVADSSGTFAVARDGTFDQPFAIADTTGYWVTRTGLWPADAVAVGPDGSRFVATNGVVYHLAPDEQPVPVAGHSETSIDHDRIEEGGPATLSQFTGISDLAVGPKRHAPHRHLPRRLPTQR